MNSAIPFGVNGWIGVLSEIFGSDVSIKIDCVDIAWDELHLALDGMEDRKIEALKYRFTDNLSLIDCALSLKKKYNRKSLRSREGFRRIIGIAIRELKHPSRMRVLRSAILASWNLEK